MELWKTSAKLKNVHCNIVHNHNSHPVANMTVVNFCEGRVCVFTCVKCETKGDKEWTSWEVFFCLLSTLWTTAWQQISLCLPERTLFTARLVLSWRKQTVLPRESTHLTCKSSADITSKFQSNMDSFCLLCYFLFGNICTLLYLISQKHRSSLFLVKSSDSFPGKWKASFNTTRHMEQLLKYG